MRKRLKRIIDLSFSKEMGILPSGLAFSFFFAVIPVLSLLFYSLTSLDFSVDIIQNFLSQTFPKGVVNLLQPVFIEDLSIPSLITLISGLIVTINGCLAIIIASNTIYNIPNAPYYKRLLKACFVTVIILVLITFIVIVPLLGNSFIKLLGTFGNVLSDNEFLINAIYFVLQVPVSLLVMYYLIKLIYVIAPDQKINNKYVTKGALFTTVTWIILTFVFSYYINNIAKYNLVYGNLSNIVILMFWFYLLAYVFVIGIIINKDTMEKEVEKTNTIKLEEIRDKVKSKDKK